MPDSTNNRLVLFNETDGSLVNSNAFGLAGSTPVHAMQVGNEIWVSEQIGDRISRWSFDGIQLLPITGPYDNVRGMEQVGDTIYLTSTGTSNGAPGRHVALFNPSGANVGTFSTPASAGFGILAQGGGLLISSDAANDDIHRYTLAGASLGTFHNSTGLNFGQQMDVAPNGDVWAAAFSSNLVVRLDPNTGAILSSFAASGARGVRQLPNGNVMWTNGSGAHVFNPGTQQSTQVYVGAGRFLDSLVIPEPATGAMILLLAVPAIGRRR
jgi:streptogramin lyase